MVLREFCLRTFECGKLIAIDSWTGVWLLHFILGALHQRVRSTINLACHGATGMQTKTKNYEGREPPLTDRKVFPVLVLPLCELPPPAGGRVLPARGYGARSRTGRHISRLRSPLFLLLFLPFLPAVPEYFCLFFNPRPGGGRFYRQGGTARGPVQASTFQGSEAPFSFSFSYFSLFLPAVPEYFAFALPFL